MNARPRGGSRWASRLVVEHGAQPALGVVEFHLLACSVIIHLILRDLADSKVLGRRCSKVEAADGRRWKHGHRFGQARADLRRQSRQK